MILRPVVLPLAAVGVVCVVVAAVTDGATGALGAALGSLLVILFLASSPWLLGPVARRSPALSLPFAVGLFAAKAVAAIIAVYILLDPDGAGRYVDARAVGITVVISAVVCSGLQIRAYRRARIPTYDLGNTA